MKPRPKALDDPATFVATQLSPVLRLLKSAVFPMWRNHLDAVVLQIIVETIAVIRFITDQLLRLRFDHAEVEGQLNERDFMVIRSVRGDRKRQTVAVHNTHDFHAFSALCRAYTVSTALGRREGSIYEALAFIYRSGLTQGVRQLS